MPPAELTKLVNESGLALQCVPQLEFLGPWSTVLGTCAPNNCACYSAALSWASRTNKTEIHCLLCQVLFLEQMATTGVQPFEWDSGTIISRIKKYKFEIALTGNSWEPVWHRSLGILPKKPQLVTWQGQDARPDLSSSVEQWQMHLAAEKQSSL